MNKVPEALRKIYKAALKYDAKIESWNDGQDVNIWTRQGDSETLTRLWVSLSNESMSIIEDGFGLGFSIYETIGIGIINPRALGVLTSWIP